MTRRWVLLRRRLWRRRQRLRSSQGCVEPALKRPGLCQELLCWWWAAALGSAALGLLGRDSCLCRAAVTIAVPSLREGRPRAARRRETPQQLCTWGGSWKAVFACGVPQQALRNARLACVGWAFRVALGIVTVT